MVLNPLQRAEAQQWAEKVQLLEVKLGEITDVCDRYLDGLITDDEAMRFIVLLVKKEK